MVALTERRAPGSAAAPSSPVLDLPRLRADQWAIAQHPAKVKVVCMGRRWGKSLLGGCIALATAAQGGRVAWIVPTYRNGRPLWRWASGATGTLRRAGVVQANASERIIAFGRSGGFVALYSMDSPDSIRGEAFNLVVLDEAAVIPEDAWTDAIQPTLADANGDAILISSPRGRNWFWREWLRGHDPLATDYAAWTAPSSANPNPQIRRAALLAKDRVPEVKYRQEWLAEFIDDGSLFRRVREAATATPQREALPGHAYVMGVDLARRVDFTVCVVIDHSLSPPAAVCMDRFTQTDWQTQVSRITALAQRFGVQAMLVDQTGLGDPVVEQLQREPTMPRGTAVLGYQLTNASKATIIESLALAFERGEIALIADPVLLGELLAYESERLPSGLVRYHAPDNQHDDAVIATALGYWAAVYGRVTVAPPLYA